MAVSAIVLAITWAVEVYAFSVVGFDLGVFAVSLLVTTILLGGDVLIWFAVLRNRETRAVGMQS
jgi:hypothetical protein